MSGSDGEDESQNSDGDDVKISQSEDVPAAIVALHVDVPGVDVLKIRHLNRRWLRDDVCRHQNDLHKDQGKDGDKLKMFTQEPLAGYQPGLPGAKYEQHPVGLHEEDAENPRQYGPLNNHVWNTALNRRQTDVIQRDDKGDEEQQKQQKTKLPVGRLHDRCLAMLDEDTQHQEVGDDAEEWDDDEHGGSRVVIPV